MLPYESILSHFREKLNEIEKENQNFLNQASSRNYKKDAQEVSVALVT